MEAQLQLCRDLFQAVLCSKDACKVPAPFNSSLLDTLQLLMLELQQQHQEEQTIAVRRCLEAVLQLLRRISCLGPIEAFFTADDLLQHYQHHINKAVKLTNSLQEQRHKRGPVAAAVRGRFPRAAPAPADLQSNSGQGFQLQLPPQHLRILASFKQQAAELCPRLTGSCTVDQLQQLCETVKEGLLLVNGHSFLIDQEWQAEVSAMMARAEQLKILLAHRQAHHISLLAAVLQQIHRAEVQEFDKPQQQQFSLPGYSTKTASSVSSLLSTGLSTTGATAGQGLPQGKLVTKGSAVLQQHEQARIVVAAGLEAAGEVLGHVDDEFYMPVAPLPALTSSACSTPRSSAAQLAIGAPALPFDLCPHSTDASDDGLARLPSSGCSSLLEYVHSIPPTTAAGAAGSSTIGEAAGGGSLCGDVHGLELHSRAQSGSSGQQTALRRITEEQLQGIAGPEIASVLAAALGVTLDRPEEDQSRVGAGGILRRSSSSRSRHRVWSSFDWEARQHDAAAATAVARPLSALAIRSSSSSFDKLAAHGVEAWQRDSGAGGLEGIARQASEPLSSRLFSGIRGTSSPLQPQQQQQQQRRRLWSGGSRCSSPATEAAGSSPRSQHPWRGGGSSSSSSKWCPQCELRLQHMLLPPGCCKSIGAVLYISPHLSRLVLSDVGLNDQAVFDLVDALKVNSSILVLDLSQNRVEDIGARALAGLLRQRAGSSSKLRALYLQANLIGDDGAGALASGLSHNNSLQHLWLQDNSIGESGALALATALQHNTSCTSLKLLTQSTEGMPVQLGKMAQKLARHNKGVREQIKRLLMHVLPRGTAPEI